MVKDLYTEDYPCSLMVSIETTKKTKIWIKVCDAKATKTFYSKWYAMVDGSQQFYIGMPQSPYVSRLVVYADGESPLAESNDYEVTEIEILPLQSTKYISLSRKTKSFVQFAQEFSQEASYLDASKTGVPYFSDNVGKYTLPKIIDILLSKKIINGLQEKQLMESFDGLITAYCKKYMMTYDQVIKGMKEKTSKYYHNFDFLHFDIVQKEVEEMASKGIEVNDVCNYINSKISISKLVKENNEDLNESWLLKSRWQYQPKYREGYNDSE